MTAIIKICAIAEASNISVIPHGGGNKTYGQHACFAIPSIPWTKCSSGILGQAPQILPGMTVPKNGKIIPSNAPGFGI